MGPVQWPSHNGCTWPHSVTGIQSTSQYPRRGWFQDPPWIRTPWELKSHSHRVPLQRVQRTFNSDWWNPPRDTLQIQRLTVLPSGTLPYQVTLFFSSVILTSEQRHPLQNQSSHCFWKTELKQDLGFKTYLYKNIFLHLNTLVYSQLAFFSKLRV